MKKMTYLEMVEVTVKALEVGIENGFFDNVDELQQAIDKLEQFKQTQINKTNYNAIRKSNRKSRVSDETRAKAEAIKRVLKAGVENALSGGEIADQVADFDLTPLAISNAIKYIKDIDIEKTKKVVEVVGKNGLTRQAEHTAYYIKG